MVVDFGFDIHDPESRRDAFVSIVDSVHSSGVSIRHLGRIIGMTAGYILNVKAGKCGVSYQSFNRLGNLAHPYVVAPDASQEEQEVFKKFGVFVFTEQPTNKKKLMAGINRLLSMCPSIDSATG